MDISGAVLRRAAITAGLPLRRDDVAVRSRVSARPRRAAIGGGVGFSDEGHVAYYVSPVRCGCDGKKGRDAVKKRAKLVKGLAEDLAALCDQSREKAITEAAQMLMEELNQLRDQEKEMKRMKKEEKSAMKASKMKKTCAEDESSSSSSESSESSDSEGECETVVNMKNLKTAMLELKPEGSASSVCQPQTDKVIEINLDSPKITQDINLDSSKFTQECCKTSIDSVRASVVVEKSADKIEVCMGGKCKKSGAMDLLQEFEKNIGIEGAVVGCKCMGKCKEGPNVRVLTQANNEDLNKGFKNPLCIGVSLEDVPEIVANFFGDDKEGMGLMAA